MKTIKLRNVTLRQAKKEIKDYFSKHHGKTIDAGEIQEVLGIDIRFAIILMEELEKEGEINEKA